jgi:hypothetical protein
METNVMKERQRLFRRIIVLTFLLCAASITSAKETRMLIDQVPIQKGVFVPEAPMGADQHPDQQAAFKKAVEIALTGKYRVIAQHFYLYPIHKQAGWPSVNPSWAPLRMSISDALGSLHGESVYRDLGLAPNPVLEIWKVGTFHRQYFALSMTHLENGNALVGYFEVEKE